MLRLFISVVLSVFIYSYAFAEEKLIFAIDVIRHGDRTPLVISRDMKNIWHQGAGQLTPLGMHQEYELGKTLRQQYVEKYHLLPKQYDISTMMVRASGMPRTLMSAQSLLYGLYPLRTGPTLNDTTSALPEGLQPIPIQTVPVIQDSLLIPNHDKIKYQQLLETYILNSPEWVQKNHMLRSNYVIWSQILGMQIGNLFDLIHAGDRLYIERLYNMPLPDGLLEKDANTILEASKWALLYMTNHPKFATVGNELAQTIKQEFNLAMEQNRPLKYMLFVAHDTTIAAQLNILGQAMDDIMPYASRLNYSLFDMGASNYEVRVTYNQKLLFIEQCGGEHCAINDFIHLMDAHYQN